MRSLTVLSKQEPAEELWDALQVVSDVLDVSICWYFRGGFHFRLHGDWTVSVTPETAGRIRVETWSLLRLRDRKWAKVDDARRLTHLVLSASDTALQPA